MPDVNQDLIGKTFSHLIVIRKSDKRGKDGAYYWVCKCDCGNITEATTAALNSGAVSSCGHIKQQNLKPSEKRHRSKLGNKVPSNNKTGHRNISKTFRNGRERYRVAVMYNRHQYGGLRDTLEEALAFREELREKYWPNYKKNETGEIKMIRWNEQDTQRVWNRTIETETMQELFDRLREIDVVTYDDINNFGSEVLDDYDDMTPEEQVAKTEAEFASMNDDELQFFISSCNIQAFYQTFKEIKN